jgi:hypothetical protein
MERFWYSQLFTVYSLIGYNIILKWDFIDTMPQEIDISMNTLKLLVSRLKMQAKSAHISDGLATEDIGDPQDCLIYHLACWENYG